MNYIVVDDEQAKIIAESGGAVEIRDQRGRNLGVVTQPITEEDIATAVRRRDSDQPRFTTQQVLDHLHSLDRK